MGYPVHVPQFNTDINAGMNRSLEGIGGGVGAILSGYLAKKKKDEQRKADLAALSTFLESGDPTSAPESLDISQIGSVLEKRRSEGVDRTQKLEDEQKSQLYKTEDQQQKRAYDLEDNATKSRQQLEKEQQDQLFKTEEDQQKRSAELGEVEGLLHGKPPQTFKGMEEVDRRKRADREGKPKPEDIDRKYGNVSDDARAQAMQETRLKFPKTGWHTNPDGTIEIGDGDPQALSFYQQRLNELINQRMSVDPSMQSRYGGLHKGEQPPEEAIAILKSNPGKSVTFDNGQIWQWDGSKAMRVK